MKGRAAAWLSLVFFGLLAFCNALRHPFVHDDVIFILQNPHISQLQAWPQAFRVHAASGGLNTYYRPLLEIAYRLEYHFFGFHPWAYHFVNVLLHIANGLLVFGLLQRLGLSRPVAWMVAILFLIHPVQTEAVGCISGISNLWMAFFVLLALHAYLRGLLAAALACFALGFFGKEQAVMLVPLIVVVDLSRGQRRNFGSWLFWALAALFFLQITQLVTGASLLKEVTASPGELFLRLKAIPRDIGMYLRLIFFPYDLHYYRSTDILASNTMSWLGAAIGVSALVYVFKRYPQSRFVTLLGFGWFLAALAPVLNIVPLINEYSFILTPEHFLYLPIAGILIVVASILKNVIPVKAGTQSLTIVIAICLLLTWHQNTYWRSEIALFERMIRFEPDFARGHLLLAKAYAADGRHQDANFHFQKAYILMSGYAQKAANPVARNFYLDYQRQILFYWRQNH